MKKIKITTLLTGILITNILLPTLEPVAYQTTNNINLEEASDKATDLIKDDIQWEQEIIQVQSNENTETQYDVGFIKTVTAEQHGDMEEHTHNNLKMRFGQNNQPTGIFARPGEILIVNVEANEGDPLPKLIFTQHEGSYLHWRETVDLKIGKNEIPVPSIPTDHLYKNTVTPGGPVYIENPYTPEQQSKAPVLKFETGQVFPVLDKNTNEKELKDFLTQYKKLLDEDAIKYPDVKDRKMIDVFEFVSDHILFTGTASAAYEVYVKENKSPLNTLSIYNDAMKEIFKFYGLDKTDEKNNPKYIRENIRLSQPYGAMYAAGNHIGVQRRDMKSLLVDNPGWGLIHEIGHKMDIGVRTYLEITNNMVAQYMSGYYGNLDERIPFETVYENTVNKWSKFNPGAYFLELSTFWQLELYKPGYWSKLERLYREREVDLGSEQDKNKMQYLVRFSSEVISEDLSEYFERHGFTVTQETKRLTSQYKKPEGKIWYINNKKYNYKRQGFSNKTRTTAKIIELPNGFKLQFDVADYVKRDLLGYEIKRDGKVIAFTAHNEYTNLILDKSKNYKYEIIPYDRSLKSGTSVILNSKPNNVTKYFVDVNGVNYYGTEQIRDMKINIDYSDNTLYLTDRNREAIHAGFHNRNYFSFTLYDGNMNEKASLNMNGNDTGDEVKYNDFNFTKFSVGDYVKIHHEEPNRIQVNKYNPQLKTEIFKITKDGLIPANIEFTTINFSGTGNGSFELSLKDKTLRVQNRVRGVFAYEYTGYDDFYIQITLKDTHGNIKTNCSLYGSMYSSNIEIDKLNDVKYEYGDVLEISNRYSSKIKINGDVIEGITKSYEITQNGLKIK